MMCAIYACFSVVRGYREHNTVVGGYTVANANLTKYANRVQQLFKKGRENDRHVGLTESGPGSGSPKSSGLCEYGIIGGRESPALTSVEINIALSNAPKQQTVFTTISFRRMRREENSIEHEE
jgi:hypothetical protein